MSDEATTNVAYVGWGMLLFLASLGICGLWGFLLLPLWWFSVRCADRQNRAKVSEVEVLMHGVVVTIGLVLAVLFTPMTPGTVILLFGTVAIANAAMRGRLI